MLFVYRLLTRILYPFVYVYLKWRQKKGKEHTSRLKERFGYATASKTKGHVVWIHAASVGEVMSVLSLSEQILFTYPDISLLITTGTLTGSQIVTARLTDKRVIHQFVPVDVVCCVQRFLTHWKPKIAIFVESELWPNLIILTKKSGAKTILLNAKLSHRSFQKWQKCTSFARRILSTFDAIYPQSLGVLVRMHSLGITDALYLGHLKFAADPLTIDSDITEKFQTKRPSFAAISTYHEEEAILFQALRDLKAQFPNMLLLLAPRHPSRVSAIIAQASAHQLSCVLRTSNSPILPHHDIFILDSIGELALILEMTDLAFLGGTLVPVGGHNPIEPVLKGCALMVGPSRENIEEICEKLLPCLETVYTKEDVVHCVSAWMIHAEYKKNKLHHVKVLMHENGSVMNRVMENLHPHFKEALI